MLDAVADLTALDTSGCLPFSVSSNEHNLTGEEMEMGVESGPRGEGRSICITKQKLGWGKKKFCLVHGDLCIYMKNRASLKGKGRNGLRQLVCSTGGQQVNVSVQTSFLIKFGLMSRYFVKTQK